MSSLALENFINLRSIDGFCRLGGSTKQPEEREKIAAGKKINTPSSANDSYIIKMKRIHKKLWPISKWHKNNNKQIEVSII